MPYVNCSCGLTYDLTFGPQGCPKCGKPAAGSAPPPAETKIRFLCTCGARLSAAPQFVGRSITCPGCGQEAPVPAESVAAAADTARRTPSTARRSGSTTYRPKTSSRPDGWRSTARWTLFVALIPLGIFAFASKDDRQERVEETKRQHPKIFKNSGDRLWLTKEEFQLLPGHRIEGAFLPSTTSAHWVAATLAALIFWEFILIVQPMGNSSSKQLWAVGIFTGTIGILMLLIVQIVALISSALNVTGGLAAPFFLILKFIGYSYWAALDPGNGFVLSMLGFTFGVGLCEELCKALPIYWHFRRSGALDMRGAVVWGLATGIGFGVSEGISYCGSFYNGYSSGGIYVVRFISCVALHAVWSATVAIFIWRQQERIQNIEHFWEWFLPLVTTLPVSMLLHGFYDTCAKKEYNAAALAVAMFSFALFFWLYDRASRRERPAAFAQA